MQTYGPKTVSNCRYAHYAQCSTILPLKVTIILANLSIYPGYLFFYTISMIYFAHRGASSLAVQNTLPAFEKARTVGAQCYELDVHLTADEQLAVHHDYSLLSTAGADVLIGALCAAELQKYPLKNSFSKDPVFVPLLSDVLPVVTPGLELLNIELKNDENKYPGIEKMLLQAVPGALLPKILFSSFDYDTLARLRALAPKARIGLLTRDFDVRQALALKAESVHINHTRLTPEIIRTCHQNNLRLYCYTVNEIETAHRLERQGVDGIFTDFIQLFTQ